MSIARRFLTGFRQTETNEPGLELNEDGTVDLVNPDGSRTALPGGSSPSVTGLLLPAQILALFTTPITLVAGTPGALTIPYTFTAFYKSGTTAYTAAGSAHMDFGNLAAQGNSITLTYFGFLLQGGPPTDVSSEELAGSVGGILNSSDSSAVLGKGLSIFADTGEYTLGDLEVAYELTYRVIVPAT